MWNLQPPTFNPVAFAVVRRNLLVWRRLIGPAILMNFGEPTLYLLGLGYGLGMFIGEMQGMSYIAFLASGIIASSTMTSASFEGTYSVFTRMVTQRTHEGMLATPIEVDDLIAGEIIWCGVKGMFSTIAILLVTLLLGEVQSPAALFAIPIGFVIGLVFAGPAIAVSAVSPGYDFFNYYFILCITPMFMVSGVFFPITGLPEAMQTAVHFLPLIHAVELVRPLVAGQPLHSPLLHLAVLLLYAMAGYYLAVVLSRRRLLV